MSRTLLDRRAGLGTHADPVYPRRRLERAVRFDRDFETEIMQSIDERRIELEQGFPTRNHDETLRRSIAEPLARHFLGQLAGA